MRTDTIATRGLNTVSPKQPAARRRRDWYPYYAGFTQRFVQAVLDEHLDKATFVVDPWSGSGTTSVACLKRGVASKGVDINPALTVIARARLTPMACKRSIADALEKVLCVAATGDTEPSPADLLEKWLTPKSARFVRHLRDAIHTVLRHDLQTQGAEDLCADSLAPMVSFFYCALFGVVRDAVRRYRATNPMWLKYPRNPRYRAKPSAEVLHQEMARQVGYLTQRLCLSVNQDATSFTTGNATRLPFGDELFDGAVTSPPYATRVDYVKGTLPELAVLGADEEYLNRLRSLSTGSPTVHGSKRISKHDLTSVSAKKLLDEIGSHRSKGSHSYYLPWMGNYLGGLQNGLKELHRTVKAKCPICIVVQDSYYKEIPISMQRIVIEAMSVEGRCLQHQYDYSAPNPRRQPAGENTRSNGTQINIESLLVFV